MGTLIGMGAMDSPSERLACWSYPNMSSRPILIIANEVNELPPVETRAQVAGYSPKQKRRRMGACMKWRPLPTHLDKLMDGRLGQS
jgi:hypothetical protein